MKLLVSILMLAVANAPAFANETNTFRWFKTPQGWCVEIDNSINCLPLTMEVESIYPSSISFEVHLPGSTARRSILFDHRASGGLSAVVDTDERVRLQETFEIPGAVAKKFMVGQSSVLEIEMTNGIRATFYGDNFDDLLDMANVVTASFK